MIDLKLIEECRSGNLNNFRTLIELTSPMAYNTAFRLLGDGERAKDVVQDTMVTIWQKLKKIKSPEVYKTWVYRIVVNKCYDQLRKLKGNPEFIPDEKMWALISDRIADGASSELELNETAKIISMLTDKLSPKQKTVFILSEIEDLSADEVAEVTGMSKTAIKANLHHARKNIAELIVKYL